MDEHAQGTEQWLLDRLGFATASKFSDVLASLKSGGESAGRKKYRTQLVLEILTGIPTEGYSSSSMEWGTKTEPMARLAYELQTEQKVLETGFLKHPTIQAGASPDGLVSHDGLIEIKCPDSSTHKDTLLADKIPTQYKPQMQGQMWITGRQWNDFVSFDPRMPENCQLYIKRMHRDEEYIANLEKQVVLFMEQVFAEVDKLLAYKTLANSNNM